MTSIAARSHPFSSVSMPTVGGLRRREGAKVRSLPGAAALAKAIERSGEPRRLHVVDLGEGREPANLLTADQELADATQALAAAATRIGAGAFHLHGWIFALLAPEDTDAGALQAAVGRAFPAEDGSWSPPLHGEAMVPAEASTAAAAVALAGDRLRARRVWRAGSASRQARDVLIEVLDARGWADHAARARVKGMAIAVARRLGLPLGDLDDLARAAELQDIGMIAVPEGVLNKKGPLTEEEWALVRRHPLAGERIVASAPALASVAPLVRSSYERWDGGGYPDGLAGQDIPLGARVVATCVALIAMTSDRPYRRALPMADAVAELRECAGKQFDPEVVEALVSEVAGE